MIVRVVIELLWKVLSDRVRIDNYMSTNVHWG